MQKKIKLVFLGAELLLSGLIIVVVNQIMWKSSIKGSYRIYSLFYLADKILENRRIQFISAEKYYLSLYSNVMLSAAN